MLIEVSVTYLRQDYPISFFLLSTIYPSLDPHDWIYSFLMQLTEANMEAFLAGSIPRNRPRVLLFSRGPSPSLTYHLVALYLHGTLDFAYASTGKGLMEMAVGRRFGVIGGERKIMVYKEAYVPVLVEKVR